MHVKLGVPETEITARAVKIFLVIPELEAILALEFVKNKLWIPQFAVTYSSIIGIELSKP